MKIACYGVRETEKIFFTEGNKNFNFELKLIPELLTHDNIETSKGCDAVMLRANCVTDEQNLKKFQEYGIKYVLTRTVGINHIDIDAAHQLGFKIARVPFYSPNAVSELAASLGCAFLRNDFYMAERMRTKKFKIDEFMFAKEIRNSTIGILGTGRIGMEAAKAFKGMGAKVIGYDIFPNDTNKEILNYVSLEELQKQSDLITVHMPYIKGENDLMLNKDFFAKMKKGSILINAARGELLDNDDLYDAIKSDHIKGAALDTLTKEGEVFFKDFGNDSIPNESIQKLWSLYPRVIITPHVGSYTDEAVKNMVETSYKNLQEFIKTGACKNSI